MDQPTNSHLRRLARRGGVKRISATIYNDVREALKERLQRVGYSEMEIFMQPLTGFQILRDVCAIVDSSGRKTVSVTDIVFTLRRVSPNSRSCLHILTIWVVR
jgi:histone H4